MGAIKIWDEVASARSSDPGANSTKTTWAAVPAKKAILAARVTRGNSASASGRRNRRPRRRRRLARTRVSDASPGSALASAFGGTTAVGRPGVNTAAHAGHFDAPFQSSAGAISRRPQPGQSIVALRRAIADQMADAG